MTSPYIVAVGGTLRPNSSTEWAMRHVLSAAQRSGARVKLISGPLLQLPLYQPDNPERGEGATGKGAGYLGMVSMLANTPWVQFNPLSLMNANKGVFGVNLGHMWGEFDRMRPWMDQLMGLWENGAIKPKIASVFKFDEAPAAHHFIQDRKNIGKVLLAP